MKRLPVIALSLCLTALVAWGCGSNHSGPTLAPSDDVENLDGNPTAPSDSTAPEDGSTSPNPDDPTAIGQVGGSTPPVPNGGALGGTNPSNTGTTRGKLDLRKDCDGNVITVPFGQTRSLFNFGRTSANANNVNRVISIKDQESGDEAEVTLTQANWIASNPTKLAPGSFAFSAGGTFPGELDLQDYSTSMGLYWNFSAQSSTCLSLTRYTAAHVGPFGGGGADIDFLDGLKLTNNRYQPMLGERHATLAIDRVAVQTSNWQSEIVAVEEYFGETFITFELRQVGAEDGLRFMWNDNHGIVAAREIYLPTENDDNLITFPGYPSR